MWDYNHISSTQLLVIATLALEFLCIIQQTCEYFTGNVCYKPTESNRSFETESKRIHEYYYK